VREPFPVALKKETASKRLMTETSEETPIDDNMVHLASYSNPSEAQLAQSVLAGSGIESFLSGEEANALLPASLGARLLVKASDEESARALLNDPPEATLSDDGNDL